MKQILLILLVSIGSLAYGQAPFGKYSYAKMYMLNTKKSTAKPDQNVWKNDRYAFTKMGDGKLLIEDQIEDLNEWGLQNLFTLETGLSKCFIPRHGIVFFDDSDRPIGSISICFECEAIRIYPEKTYKDNKLDAKKALKQLKFLEKLVNDLELPIYSVGREYEKLHENGEYAQKKKTIDVKQKNYADLLLKLLPTSDEVRKKIKISRAARLVEKKPVKEVDGKTITYLEQTFYSSKINYEMGKNTWELKYMVINNPGFVFDNGVTVGMSQEHFLKTLDGYAYDKNPEKITINDSGRNMTFWFEEKTLRRIEIKVDQWVN